MTANGIRTWSGSGWTIVHDQGTIYPRCTVGLSPIQAVQFNISLQEATGAATEWRKHNSPGSVTSTGPTTVRSQVPPGRNSGK